LYRYKFFEGNKDMEKLQKYERGVIFSGGWT